MNARSVALVFALVTSVALACGESAKPPAAPEGPAASAEPTPAPNAEAPPAPSAEAAPSATPPAPAAEASAAPPAPSAAPPAPSAASAAEKPAEKKPADKKGIAVGEPNPSAPPAAGGEDACKITSHYAALKSACASGGRKAAKEVMKGVVKKAKAAGADLMCGSCHVDMRSFALKPNALGDLKKWL